MQYELRRVPANWQHPVENGQAVELKFDFTNAHEGWSVQKAKWQQGEKLSHSINPEWVPLDPEDLSMSFEDATEKAEPEAKDYLPEWPEEEKTHYQMYELTGMSPVSPVVATKEELAQSLASNPRKIDHNYSYEQWMDIIEKGGTEKFALQHKIRWNNSLAQGFEYTPFKY